jgi:hypothetical protein
MVKRRMLKLAIAVVTVLAPTAAVTAATGGVGFAAGVTPAYSGTFHTTSGGNIFYPRGGGGPYYLPPNDSVRVNCYYTGASVHGDNYQDHVTWTQYYGGVPGHIPDYYVNLGGLVPPQLGIPHC